MISRYSTIGKKKCFVFCILRLNVKTGDDRTSHLTRLGVNQIRGVVSQIHDIIRTYQQKLPKDTYMFPIKIVAEPTIQSAESCFHVRSLLLNANYTVSEQVTDLGIQYNYFQRSTNNIKICLLIYEIHICIQVLSTDFIHFQRIQILYMLRHYLAPDTTDSKRPSLQIHILCGNGLLFTAFRQETALKNLLLQPYPRFSTLVDPGHNALKHGYSFFFEAIGANSLRLHDVLTLLASRNILDEQKIGTDQSLQMSFHDFDHWFQSQSGPCTLSYFLANEDRLSSAIVHSATLYQQHVRKLVRKEWHPYLAGMLIDFYLSMKSEMFLGLFIYACRLQLTLAGMSRSCKQQAASPIVDEISSHCTEQELVAIKLQETALE